MFFVAVADYHCHDHINFSLVVSSLHSHFVVECCVIFSVASDKVTFLFPLYSKGGATTEKNEGLLPLVICLVFSRLFLSLLRDKRLVNVVLPF